MINNTDTCNVSHTQCVYVSLSSIGIPLSLRGNRTFQIHDMWYNRNNNAVWRWFFSFLYTKERSLFYDEDADIFENYVQYCSQLINFKNQHGRDIERNDRCLCGSGKKFKKCCHKKYEQAKFIYDMICYDQTNLMHTRSNYGEMPINEFWGLKPDLPDAQRKIINDVERATTDNTALWEYFFYLFKFPRKL